MPTLPSVATPGYGLKLASPGSANLGAGVATWTPAVGLAGAPGKGAASGTGIVQAAHWSISGQGLVYFASQLYGHIHVFPSVLALGNLLSTQSRQVEVWNARMDAQLLSALLAANADGVSWSGPPAPPTTFGPMESRIYDFSISNAGASALAALFTWQFAAEQPRLTVTATRIITVAYEPDWSEPPEETLEWKTNVLRAYAGQQQRVKLRGKPRRRVAYSYVLEDGFKGARFQSMTWGWQQRIFAVPIWMDQDQLAADLAQGSLSLGISTSLKDYATDGLVLLWRSHLEWEVVEVQSFTASLVALKKPTQQAWAKGSRVVPMRVGRMPKALDFGRHTTTISQVRVEWAFEPETGLGANRTQASGLPIYRGYEVLTDESDWSQDVGEQVERDLDLVDFETGAVAADAHTGAPEHSRPFHWVLKGRDAIAKALAFLATREGKAVPFWLPTMSQDLEQTQDAAAADVTIQVRDTQYSLYYALHPNRRDLAFFPFGGAPVLRRITGATPGAAGFEWITLDQSFGVIRKAADWRCISFLAFVTLEQDSVRIAWETDDLARVSFRVREVLL